MKVKPKRMIIDIDEELHTLFKIYCAKKSATIKDVITDFIKKIVRK